MKDTRKKICGKCNSAFSCGGECWCNDFPTILPLNPISGCMCKACLTEHMVKKILDFTKELSINKIIKVQQLGKPDSLIENIDYTVNPEGYLVMSSWYLLRQGKCCKNGCTNCPYTLINES